MTRKHAYVTLCHADLRGGTWRVMALPEEVPSVALRPEGGLLIMLGYNQQNKGRSISPAVDQDSLSRTWHLPYQMDPLFNDATCVGMPRFTAFEGILNLLNPTSSAMVDSGGAKPGVWGRRCIMITGPFYRNIVPF